MCLPVKPYRVEREWEHSGLKCAVVQAREGQHRCGYVRVPPGHALHGKDYGTPDVDVHGGLTFAEAEPCAHEDGVGWWFGFDCAHAGDATFDPNAKPDELSESAKKVLKVHRDMDIRFGGRHEHFWTQTEVEREIERLAEQLSGSTYAGPIRTDNNIGLCPGKPAAQ
jgi:hypothetical protein